MQKIFITPVDNSIKDRANAVKILNEFKVLGFDTRSGFVGVIQASLPKYKDYHMLKRILWFWESRKFDAELNTELEKLIETLRNE